MWHADIQQAHFELEDAEAEKALTVVTGTRPVFFLKTNGMLRGRRDRHPVQQSKLSQKIADERCVRRCRGSRVDSGHY